MRTTSCINSTRKHDLFRGEGLRYSGEADDVREEDRHQLVPLRFHLRPLLSVCIQRKEREGVVEWEAKTKLWTLWKGWERLGAGAAGHTAEGAVEPFHRGCWPCGSTQAGPPVDPGTLWRVWKRGPTASPTPSVSVRSRVSGIDEPSGVG